MQRKEKPVKKRGCYSPLLSFCNSLFYLLSKKYYFIKAPCSFNCFCKISVSNVRNVQLFFKVKAAAVPAPSPVIIHPGTSRTDDCIALSVDQEYH